MVRSLVLNSLRDVAPFSSVVRCERDRVVGRRRRGLILEPFHKALLTRIADRCRVKFCGSLMRLCDLITVDLYSLRLLTDPNILLTQFLFLFLDLEL